MAEREVVCSRELRADADSVWCQLADFDLLWHPAVERCHTARQSDGALQREFTDSDGNRYTEQLTYISDTGRTLCYCLLSGVEGMLRYRARVAVNVTDQGKCLVHWSATISAVPTRIEAIATGTKSIFEMAIDALDQPFPSSRNLRYPSIGQHKVRREIAMQPLQRGTAVGSPELSYLSARSSVQTERPLVVLLHGIGGQAANWEQQLTALGSNYSMQALDLRGYGGSAPGLQQSVVEDYCSDILRLQNAFDAPQLVLVGLSYGSWIATSFAMRHPQLLAGLVLAGGCTGMSEAAPSERNAFLKARSEPLQQGLTPADFAAGVVDIIAGPNATAEQRHNLHNSMAEIPVATYTDALHCFCHPEETFDFSRINCPVMMLTGEHDRLAAPDEIFTVSQRMFNARASHPAPAEIRYEVIADAGHVCNIEQPAEFNLLLDSFLSCLPQVAHDYKQGLPQKQQQKKRCIIDAAHQEFCSNGFDGASMARVAKLAQVSKPTLYQYFGDKEGLFAAVLDEGRKHLVAPLFSSEGSLVERLWVFSWSYADFVLREDMLSLARLILGEATRRPGSAAAYHHGGPGKAFSGIVAFIQECVDSGSLSVTNAELAAQDLWSLILSGPRDYYLHHVNERPDRGALLQSITHGLRGFLTLYSTSKDHDLAELEQKISEHQQIL